MTDRDLLIKLMHAIDGIRSCATSCICCEAHQEICADLYPLIVAHLMPEPPAEDS